MIGPRQPALLPPHLPPSLPFWRYKHDETSSWYRQNAGVGTLPLFWRYEPDEKSSWYRQNGWG